MVSQIRICQQTALKFKLLDYDKKTYFLLHLKLILFYSFLGYFYTATHKHSSPKSPPKKQKKNQKKIKKNQKKNTKQKNEKTMDSIPRPLALNHHGVESSQQVNAVFCVFLRFDRLFTPFIITKSNFKEKIINDQQQQQYTKQRHRLI